MTSADLENRPIGMSIGSFTLVSLAPPLVAFFPDRRSATFQRIRGSECLCVNVLGDHQEQISRQFATSTADKFAGLVHRSSELRLPILDGVVA